MWEGAEEAGLWEGGRKLLPSVELTCQLADLALPCGEVTRVTRQPDLLTQDRSDRTMAAPSSCSLLLLLIFAPSTSYVLLSLPLAIFSCSFLLLLPSADVFFSFFLQLLIASSY